ncbi:MAG: S-layer homology domain-containing protein [Candidatus Ancillula sp.]|jgi:hypothetical protein|nr:S-layer homology domain-containing protein [Candidatus Ancillula sp.]
MNIKKITRGAIGAFCALSLGVLGVVTGSIALWPIDSASAFEGTTNLNIADLGTGKTYTDYEKDGLVTTYYGGSDATDNHVRFGDAALGKALCPSYSSWSEEESKKVNNGFSLDIKLYDEADTSKSSEPLFKASGTSASNELKLTSTGFNEGQYLQILCRPDSYKEADGDVVDLAFKNVPGLGDLKNGSTYPVTVKVTAGGQESVNNASLSVSITPTPFTLPENSASIVHLLLGDEKSVTNPSAGTLDLDTIKGKSVDFKEQGGTLTLYAERPGVTKFSLKKDGTTTTYTVIVNEPATIPTVDLAKLVIGSTEDAHFQTQIKDLLNKNISTGVGDPSGNIRYYAEDYMTRGQLAAMLYRASGSPEVTQSQIDSNFADSKDNQFANAIAWLKGNGIVDGIDGKFYPNDNIKRGEVAKIITNTFSLDLLVSSSDTTQPFSDVPDTDTQWYKFVQPLKALSIINGVDDKFYPSFKINRGQIAKIISLALVKLKPEAVS